MDEHVQEDRLESWKAVANHLNRSVRTVRRWEQQEGLPVHRHLHGSGATIHAFRSELDDWMKARVETPEGMAGLSRYLWLGVAAATVGALALFAVLLFPRMGEELPALRDPQDTWLLVTTFENDTDEAALSGSLEHIMEGVLRGHGFRVVDPERVNTILRLMERDPGTPLDEALGTEVAIRDGEIGLVIGGEITAIEDELVVRAMVTNPFQPGGSRALDPVVLDRASLIDSLTSVSNTLASRLNDLSASPQPLTPYEYQVTTDSLEALQLFARADALIPIGRREEASDMLKRAVELDPDFASAHLWLSYVGPGEEREMHRQQSLALVDSVSERERMFIEEDSVDDLLALVRAYPDHYYGIQNLLPHLVSSGRMAEALPIALRNADAHPRNLGAQFWYAAILYSEGQFDAWLRIIERVRRLENSLIQAHGGIQWATLVTLPLTHYWLQGDEAASRAYADDLLAEVADRPPGPKFWVSLEVAVQYLNLGDLEAGKRLVDEIVGTYPPIEREVPGLFRPEPDPALAAALYELSRKDREAFGRAIQPASHYNYLAYYLPWAGQSELARPLMEGIERNPLLRMTAGHLMKGSLLLYDEEDPAAAIAEFDQTLDNGKTRPRTIVYRLIALEFKARALLELERPVEAIEVLQEAESTRRPGAMMDAMGILFWLRCRDLLDTTRAALAT